MEKPSIYDIIVDDDNNNDNNSINTSKNLNESSHDYRSNTQIQNGKKNTSLFSKINNLENIDNNLTISQNYKKISRNPNYRKQNYENFSSNKINFDISNIINLTNFINSYSNKIIDISPMNILSKLKSTIPPLANINNSNILSNNQIIDNSNMTITFEKEKNNLTYQNNNYNILDSINGDNFDL